MLLVCKRFKMAIIIGNPAFRWSTHFHLYNNTTIAIVGTTKYTDNSLIHFMTMSYFSQIIIDNIVFMI